MKTWKLVIKGPNNHLYLLQFTCENFTIASEQAKEIFQHLQRIFREDGLYISKLTEDPSKNPTWNADY